METVAVDLKWFEKTISYVFKYDFLKGSCFLGKGKASWPFIKQAG